MSVFFTEGRGLPKEFTRADMGRYGDTGSDIANIIEKASPFDFLTGVFVTKPAQERAAQVAIAQSQAEEAAVYQQAKQKTTRTVVMVGAGLLGLLALVMIMRPRPAAAVAGYRKHSRRSRSRR